MPTTQEQQRVFAAAQRYAKNNDSSEYKGFSYEELENALAACPLKDFKIKRNISLEIKRRKSSFETWAVMSGERKSKLTIVLHWIKDNIIAGIIVTLISFYLIYIVLKWD